MAVSHMKEHHLDSEVTLKNQLNIYTFNSLWKVITGEKLGYGDPKLKGLIVKVHALLTSTSQVGAIQLFSWLKYVAPEASGYNSAVNAMLDVLGFVDDTCKSHQDACKEEEAEEATNYIDGYLR